MIIGNVPIRRGTAHLQPDRVQLLGRETAGRDEQRDAMFLRALKRRLGYVNPLYGQEQQLILLK